MNIKSKYNIEFEVDEGFCITHSYGNYSILANFLMHWGNNPIEIVNTLIPEINFGLKYGTEDRYCKYAEVEGLEQKMKDRWYQSNLEGIREKVNIEESWNRIKSYQGYYIKELDYWLEGIGADIYGLAFVTSNNTSIEASDIGDASIVMPSEDFKEIVIEWLAFILRNKHILPKK